MKLAVLLALAGTAAAEVSYQTVAPILNRNCVPCHRDGQIGPFPLTSESEARRHATQIAEVTRTRYMPPWLPVGDDFKDARRLTSAEIKLLAQWSVAPAHSRDIQKAPAASRTDTAPLWQLGSPDLILEVPTPYTLPASGQDIFRNFVIPAPTGPARYVRAVELHPGNPKLVHHANVVIDRARTLRAQNGTDGQPGFPGMDVSTESGNTFDPDSHFLFWKPASPPETDPPDMSWRLDQETDLILNLHLRPSGKPEQIRPVIGIYFSPTPPTRFPILLQLEHDGAINIPPGAPFTITDQLNLPTPVELLRIYPHAHYLGKRIEAWAKLPDGTRKNLIRIEDWDLNWQGVFTYKQPVHLPAGTVLNMSITYDNSAANPRNPANPPVRVRSGNRSDDEMGHVWLQVLPTAKSPTDPRLSLEEAAMRRRLAKYPADLLAHYNLGALLEIEERHQEAIHEFEGALELEPDRAAARNALAASLLASGRNNDALLQWRETIRRTPSYSVAHFNLARLLSGLDDAVGAVAEYQVYLQQHPEDPEAHLNLGRIYIQTHQLAQALPEYAQACKLDPANADALTDYGTLLARRGNLPEAIAQFEAALRIDAANKIAQQNLAKAKASLAAQ